MTRSRQLAAGGASVAIVLVIAILVALYGVQSYPDLPTVENQPQPEVSGQLAYVMWDDPQGSCLYVLDPGRDRQQLRCGDFDQVVAWEDGLIAVRRFGPGRATVELVDPATGDVVRQYSESVAREPVPGIRSERADGTRLELSSRDGTAMLVAVDTEGDERTLLSLEGPRNYRFEDPAWSTDGGWATVLDSGGRLILVRTQGDPAPRILLDDAPWGAQLGGV